MIIIIVCQSLKNDRYFPVSIFEKVLLVSIKNGSTFIVSFCLNLQEWFNDQCLTSHCQSGAFSALSEGGGGGGGEVDLELLVQQSKFSDLGFIFVFRTEKVSSCLQIYSIIIATV